MSLLARYKASAATLVAATAAVAVAGLLFASAAHTEDLKSYELEQERLLAASAGRLVHG